MTFPMWFNLGLAFLAIVSGWALLTARRKKKDWPTFRIGRKMTAKEKKDLTTMHHWNGNGQHKKTGTHD